MATGHVEWGAWKGRRERGDSTGHGARTTLSAATCPAGGPAPAAGTRVGPWGAGPTRRRPRAHGGFLFWAVTFQDVWHSEEKQKPSGVTSGPDPRSVSRLGGGAELSHYRGTRPQPVSPARRHGRAPVRAGRASPGPQSQKLGPPNPSEQNTQRIFEREAFSQAHAAQGERRPVTRRPGFDPGQGTAGAAPSQTAGPKPCP